jgi:hypothetical protein
MKSIPSILLAGATLFSLPAYAAELRGSPASMVQQNQVARAEGYTFVRSPSQVEKMVDKKHLVEVKGNADYQVLPSVSYPYARPAVVLLLERLSAQYREACGERLVVTSLTRPTSQQPANAHQLSVHPTGMAVDLRISQRAACRQWLESTLLSLEEKKLLDVTRERTPPHYHVAVFPEAYTAYVERQRAAEAEREEAAVAVKATPAKPAPAVPTPEPATEQPEEERSGTKGPLLAAVLLAGAMVTRSRRRR